MLSFQFLPSWGDPRRLHSGALHEGCPIMHEICCRESPAESRVETRSRLRVTPNSFLARPRLRPARSRVSKAAWAQHRLGEAASLRESLKSKAHIIEKHQES